MDEYITLLCQSEKYRQEKKYEDTCKSECLKYCPQSAFRKRNINTSIHRNQERENENKVHGRSDKDFRKRIAYETEGFRGLKFGGKDGGKEYEYPHPKYDSEES